jgi:hypothetical protein
MQPETQREDIQQHVERALRAEDDAILDAALAGAGQTPPCGVRVHRVLGGPTRIAVDPSVPAGEVYVHAA